MMAPVINYRWSGLPRGLARQLYRRQPLGDQWSLRVAYNAPWLLHWWMNQTWLPTSTVIKGSGSFPNALDEKNRVMALSNGMFQKVRLLLRHPKSFFPCSCILQRPTVLNNIVCFAMRRRRGWRRSRGCKSRSTGTWR